MISLETVLALTQLARFATDNLEAGMSGEKTDEEIMADRDEMVKKVLQASARWNSA